MKDKEKQIDEMAKVIGKTWLVDLEGDTKDVREVLDEVDIKGIAEAILPLVKQYQEQAVKDFAEKLKVEIEEALESNYKVKQHNEDIRDYCNGKIDCLRGIDNFIDETLKEVIGEKE